MKPQPKAKEIEMTKPVAKPATEKHAAVRLVSGDAPRDAFDAAQENRRLRIELDRMQKELDQAGTAVKALSSELVMTRSLLADVRRERDSAFQQMLGRI